MNVRHKIFLLLSLVLLGSIIVYIWVYSQIEQQRLMESLNYSSQQAEISFKSVLDSTESQMLQIATVVANDKKVQPLFLLGKQALELEGGGAGGELSNQVRTSLFEHLQQSQSVLREQFGFRQLHFHLGPGALSFLRVHQPEKFGDRLDNVRHTIVATNTEKKDVTGFETGRVASGIRGVTPVYAYDGRSKKKVYVGALEAGTSFTNMLSLFKKNHPKLNATVLLNHEHLQNNLWPESLEKIIADNKLIDDFYIEATTSPDFNHFLTTSKALLSPGQILLQENDDSYYFTSFPLRDFRGKMDSDVPDAGVIVVWEDISAQIANHHDRVLFLIFYGFLLFIGLEVLMFFALNLMTKQLQNELLQTREHEIAAEQARVFAEKSSRLKTVFLNNMSHELRTPMNAIIGLGQLLSKTPLSQQQQSHIDKINLSSKNLLTLIDEVLLISDMDFQPADSLPVESFDPKHLLLQIRDNFSSKAESNDVAIQTNIPSQLPDKVDGHPGQLELILNQLVGNAIKFNSGQDIILSLLIIEQTDSTVTLEFTVIDKGIGISEEQQRKIFQPFYQGDGSKTRAYGGTGLGLTIAQKICHQFGSELKLNSVLGQGSRFSFCLQLKKSAVTSVEISDPSSDLPANESPAELPLGTTTELAAIIHQLEEPLSKLQALPCQTIIMQLNNKQWPEHLSRQVDTLRNLTQQYRFIEAHKIVLQLQESLS